MDGRVPDCVGEFDLSFAMVGILRRCKIRAKQNVTPVSGGSARAERKILHQMDAAYRPKLGADTLKKQEEWCIGILDKARELSQKADGSNVELGHSKRQLVSVRLEAEVAMLYLALISEERSQDACCCEEASSPLLGVESGLASQCHPLRQLAVIEEWPPDQAQASTIVLTIRLRPLAHLQPRSPSKLPCHLLMSVHCICCCWMSLHLLLGWDSARSHVRYSNNMHADAFLCSNAFRNVGPTVETNEFLSRRSLQCRSKGASESATAFDRPFFCAFGALHLFGLCSVHFRWISVRASPT